MARLAVHYLLKASTSVSDYMVKLNNIQRMHNIEIGIWKIRKIFLFPFYKDVLLPDSNANRRIWVILVEERLTH